jgi:prolyl-tRNA synthetase
MGGSLSEEFMAFSPNGEDTILLCDNCDYGDNQEVAMFKRPEPITDAQLPVEEVETPSTPTIQALADFLKIPLVQTAKAVFFKGKSGKFIFAVIRGDLEVNETKLRQVTGEVELNPATTEEIRAIGAEPGYGSPVGVKNAVIVADESVRDTPNLVSGANKPGYHLRNVNLGRDYQADIVADIALTLEGYPCPKCGSPLRADRAIEVGNIFKLGAHYSVAFGADYLDANGESHPILMGCYGIGSGRTVATVVEQHYDDKGITWPVAVAPYHVSLLSLGSAEDAEVIAAADKLYDDLTAEGIEVLFDDRDERAGVKFNDADLIGNPVRVSVSPRTLKNGEAEIKARKAAEASFVPLADVVESVKSLIDQIQAEEETTAGLR